MHTRKLKIFADNFATLYFTRISLRCVSFIIESTTFLTKRLASIIHNQLFSRSLTRVANAEIDLQLDMQPIISLS